jgi:hypothetical protein
MLCNGTGCVRSEAYESLRTTLLAQCPGGLSQDRLDVLFHSSFVSTDVSRNLSPRLTSRQQKKNLSFWICQGLRLGVVEIGREWQPVCARILNC